jgi:hypothetical protein
MIRLNDNKVVKSSCLQVKDALLGKSLSQISIFKLLDENPYIFSESLLVLQLFASYVILQFSLFYLAQGFNG